LTYSTIRGGEKFLGFVNYGLLATEMMAVRDRIQTEAIIGHPGILLPALKRLFPRTPMPRATG
jgi:hypothetical protein